MDKPKYNKIMMPGYTKLQRVPANMAAVRKEKKKKYKPFRGV